MMANVEPAVGMIVRVANADSGYFIGHDGDYGVITSVAIGFCDIDAPFDYQPSPHNLCYPNIQFTPVDYKGEAV